METAIFNTKLICSGAFGLGTDPNCNMFVDVPYISADATVLPDSYKAAAMAFADLLTVSNEPMTSPG